MFAKYLKKLMAHILRLVVFVRLLVGNGFAKPVPEIAPETNEAIPPSPDVENPLPNHEP